MMKLKTMLVTAVACLLSLALSAQSQRETVRLDKGWKFAFGHATDPQKDFGCGTEYFNYLTKANSRIRFGKRKDTRPSKFLTEILSEETRARMKSLD